MNSNKPKSEMKKLEVNLVANIINNHFLDSDYQGKDWELVRKSLIAELNNLFEQSRQQFVEEMKKEISTSCYIDCQKLNKLLDKLAKLNQE